MVNDWNGKPDTTQNLNSKCQSCKLYRLCDCGTTQTGYRKIVPVPCREFGSHGTNQNFYPVLPLHLNFWHTSSHCQSRRLTWLSLKEVHWWSFAAKKRVSRRWCCACRCSAEVQGSSRTFFKSVTGRLIEQRFSYFFFSNSCWGPLSHWNIFCTVLLLSTTLALCSSTEAFWTPSLESSRFHKPQRARTERHFWPRGVRTS